MTYLLVAAVLVGGGYVGDFRVIAQEPDLEQCQEAKKELLAIRASYGDNIGCVRGTAVMTR